MGAGIGIEVGRRRASPALVVLLAILLALGAVLVDRTASATAAQSSSVSEARAERDRIERELQDALGELSFERGELTDIRTRLELARGQLRIAEGQLALAEDALSTADVRAEVADQELAIATRLLGDAESELLASQAEFADQVVAAYKYGAAARGEMLVTMFKNAKSPGDLVNNLYRMGAVIDHQDSVVQRITTLRNEQSDAELDAKGARLAADEAKSVAEQELIFVTKRRVDAQEFQRLVANEEAAQSRVLNAASGDAKALSAALDRAEEKVKKAEAAERRAAAASRGGILCPIDPVWFSNDWGYPRSGGRSHKGNDLFADAGTPIVAIAAGTIRRLDYTNTYVPGSNRGDLGGISISYWVDSNEYWYWAHLQSLAPGMSEGDSIAAGQLIGYVGKTGNAYNTPPHAHVGRYVNGAAVNPYPTLNPACN